MSVQKPTLGYWRIRGLGQPIRLLLHYLEIDFEDKYYIEDDEWLADKGSLGLPFPNIPYLLDGENKITESRAIMKYLSRTRKPELLGKTPEVQTKIDMVDNFMYDVCYTGLIPVLYEYTEERHKKWLEEEEPKKLRYLADFMQANNWVAGNDMTYIDFFTYEILYHMTKFNPKCLDKFPMLKEYIYRFEELPAIQKYMNSESFLESPCYSRFALYKI